MTRSPARFALLAAALMLASAAAAESPCGEGTLLADAGGLGGTGRSAPGGLGGTGHQDPGGVGGTGRQDPGGVGGTGHEDPGGVGGTGREEPGGVGGTGIFGAITGFGSICVNGQRIAYGDDTPVWIDGRASHAGALRIGHVVWVRAHASHQGTPAELVAERIDVWRAIQGVVVAREGVTGTLTVADTAVAVPERTPLVEAASGAALSLEDLEVGDLVVVSGLPRPEGGLSATRIERRSAPAPSVPGLPEVATLARRDRVARVSVEGFVAPPTGGAPPRVAGLAIALPQGAPAAAGLTGRVWVAGPIDTSGLVRAERVETPPRPPAVPAPAPVTAPTQPSTPGAPAEPSVPVAPAPLTPEATPAPLPDAGVPTGPKAGAPSAPAPIPLPPAPGPSRSAVPAPPPMAVPVAPTSVERPDLPPRPPVPPPRPPVVERPPILERPPRVERPPRIERPPRPADVRPVDRPARPVDVLR